MQCGRFRHKGLRQLYEDDEPKGVPASAADKLRKLLLVLETADNLDQVSRFPGWKLHPLKGVGTHQKTSNSEHRPVLKGESSSSPQAVSVLSIIAAGVGGTLNLVG